ncbi:MAG TPA: response regulator, partial [Allocoleopsis sp.]
SNAVKFTPQGGRVEVEVTQTEAQLDLVVRDTGIGIKPEFLPYVFDRFRQSDGSTTREFRGLGLGLAIVRQVVELHGGTVQAESDGEGQGARFTVRLPLMTVATALAQDLPIADQLVQLPGLQALVIDDEPDLRDIIAFVLEQAGATVRLAASASAALQLIEQSLPDVIVCDIGMPNMDGYMLMRQLRALPPEQGGQIPAIALTAYAGESDRQQALAAGFQQHLAKPVEPDELVNAVAKLTQFRS